MDNQQQTIRHIMLVDDDRLSNMISAKIIAKNFSYIVSAFTNAREALKSLKQWIGVDNEQIPDIIFLDINMPHMDGWEFLDEFQELYINLSDKCKVIMLSSSLDRRDIEKSKTYQCVTEFISKPLTSEKVKMLVVEPQLV
jgi:CheY-like chemotaxis protein